MTLTSNRDVDHYVDQEIRSYRVAAGQTVFKGALVTVNAAGYAKPAANGEKFVGIAYEEMDNSTGVDGDLSVRVFTVGDFGHPLAGADASSVGRPVFASADDTLTFFGAGNSYVGIVEDVVSSGEIILRIDPGSRQIKTLSHPVEDIVSGFDIAARAIHAFDAEGWLVSARIVNQATAAAGIDNSNTCVIALATVAGAVVTTTYDATNVFPAPNSADDLGTLANQQVGAGSVLTLAVTNGAAADPGPFLVEVDFV